MKIKVKEIVENCMPVRSGGEKSDCFDLCLAEDITLKKGEVYVARLGIATELPKGIVAKIYSRSSSPSKLGVTLANGLGFIDTIYNGDTDEWKAPLYAFKAVTIPKGTRICQFEVKLSQFATRWQKIKWLLSSKIFFKLVESLGNKDRKGLGSTGK